jgi:hypothetical protein
VTNSQLLDLLREARECVQWRKESLWSCDHTIDDCTCDFEATLSVLLARIDAALADQGDSATPIAEPKSLRALPEVLRDWHSVNSPNRLELLFSDGTRLTVRKADINGTVGWLWDTEIHPKGFKLTLEDAKSAAIEAAKGMR